MCATLIHLYSNIMIGFNILNMIVSMSSIKNLSAYFSGDIWIEVTWAFVPVYH